MKLAEPETDHWPFRLSSRARPAHPGQVAPIGNRLYRRPVRRGLGKGGLAAGTRSQSGQGSLCRHTCVRASASWKMHSARLAGAGTTCPRMLLPLKSQISNVQSSPSALSLSPVPLGRPNPSSQADSPTTVLALSPNPGPRVRDPQRVKMPMNKGLFEANQANFSTFALGQSAREAAMTKNARIPSPRPNGPPIPQPSPIG
jgi:hypothetical protein